jgi:anti-sigma B factor antagonist
MQTHDGSDRATPRREDFSVTMRREQDSAVIEVRGELDLATADSVREAIRVTDESEIGRVVVDLSEVTFLDSTGLGMLLEARARDRELADRLRFVAPQHDQVSRLLALTGTRELLELD